MGMTGQYLAVTSEVLQSIRSEEVSIHSLETGLDIDKSWQALHYVLCGTIADGEPPLGLIVPMSGSHYIGHLSDMDVFALSPTEVEEALSAVEKITAAELKEQYDFADLLEQGVYPVMEDEDPEAFFEYIYEHFTAIRDFYAKVTAEGKQILFYIF
ncbi:YfbM family protein [Paenibacillus donghaensis]|uniref:DUF1877 domain-containing protein n=1 Tax=Paenibacillus donghaensis TaxID=414771 RepID=A0A2Z2KBE7_9BACL|nr:YfbM family protein [Paenibacillus donghaensis]ASA20213.1 hypothetical protein B9T62_04990 [Paenibacillus donghaensis]